MSACDAVGTALCGFAAYKYANAIEAASVTQATAVHTYGMCTFMTGNAVASGGASSQYAIAQRQAAVPTTTTTSTTSTTTTTTSSSSVCLR